MDLRNRIAIVTGAGTGIGRATAIELAKRGCTVALAGRRREKIDGTLTKVQKYAPDSMAESCDVCNSTQTQQFVRAVDGRYGRIDILVNNAGIMIVKPFLDMTEEEFDSQIEIDFYGAVRMIRCVAPIMQKQGKGCIINVTSSGSKLIMPGNSAYSAGKAGLNAFSESINYEFANKGIHVGLVLPGGTHTNLLDNSATQLGEYYRSQGTMSPERIAYGILKAIEKEQFLTIIPISDRIYIAFRAHFGGFFRNMVLKRLRPYMQ